MKRNRLFFLCKPRKRNRLTKQQELPAPLFILIDIFKAVILQTASGTLHVFVAKLLDDSVRWCKEKKTVLVNGTLHSNHVITLQSTVFSHLNDNPLKWVQVE